MKIELHILQNFAPSNLNRDDTGAPKDCEFGGHRRARVSSQCLKRAIRQSFLEHKLFGEHGAEQLAVRTKRLVDHAAGLLAEQGRDPETAKHLVATALAGVKLKADEDDRKTQYLLYLPRRTIRGLADLVGKHWDALVAAVPAPQAAEDDDGKKAKRKGNEKKTAKDAVPKEISTAVSELLRDVSKTPDLALFGRMIADNADWNTDASCQVAHALSTHRVSMDFDFFTAVDDLKPKDTAGSDMMGTVAFNSACFYRYACLDADALRKNLGGTDAAEATTLWGTTIQAFLRASALAIPTGKQNSMAALNLPSYLLAVVRRGGAPLSLANAFVRPIRPKADSDLVRESADALESYFARTQTLWGDAGVSAVSCADFDVGDAKGLSRAKTFDDFVGSVLAAAARGDA